MLRLITCPALNLSMMFLAPFCNRGWIQYLLPSIFVFVAILMLWRRYFRKGRSLEAFIVTPPANRNAVEQLLTLQEAITHFEAVIQAANITLLKLRALLLAILPQVSILVMLYFYNEKNKTKCCACSWSHT